MRTIVRLLSAAVFVVIVAAGLNAVLPRPSEDTSGSTSDSTALAGLPVSKNLAQGTLNVLPAIAQHSSTPTHARGASQVAVATTPTGIRSAVVVLEQLTSDGWRIVATTSPGPDGKATFRIPATRRPPRLPLRASSVNAEGVVVSRTEPTTPPAWKLAFDDQFGTQGLNTEKWLPRQLGMYNPDGSRTCSMSDESTVAVRDGVLQLMAMTDPDRVDEACYTKYGTFDYMLNGHVATAGKFDFTHGVAAARIKFPQGRGQHGAFWMQTTAPDKVPGNPAVSGAEIDVVEFFGEGYPEGGLASFIYYLNQAGENEKVGGVWPRATRQLPPGDAWWRSYHVFSVEWTPKQYVFRVDGREIFRTKEGVSGVPQYLILSLLTSDWELPKLDEESLPTTMEVDWVRVWQQR